MPVSFDIETSSWKDEAGNKRANMYIWMMSVNGVSTYGRTWNQLRWFLEEIAMKLKLSHDRRMVVYVHNLSYEFQFMKNQLFITEVFARKKRHPIKCLINDCFEFRCSYFLSGLSLAKVAENIQSVKIEKKVGDLDYSKIRHYNTSLTDTELGYCEYDVKILHYFILDELKKNDNDITKIPLTKTGYVRLYCRNYIKANTNYKQYHDMILNESPNEDLFILLYKAFAGGYTHANAYHSRELLHNVGSNDLSSSYPSVMLSEMFPRGKFTKRENVSVSQFKRLVNLYACVFEIKLKNVKSKSPHHTLSKSKCIDMYKGDDNKKVTVDNGRIINATEIVTYMTDIDWKSFNLFYDVEDNDIEILNMYTTHYGYLPKQLIECLLYIYKDKTQLKDVEDKIEEYLVSKGMFNGIYGMCVTNPLMDEIIYDSTAEKDWGRVRPEIGPALRKVYTNMNTFLSYQWGVWVTAYARYNLLSTLNKVGNDGVYCDTDSIKMLNYNEHKHIFDEYNDNIVKKLTTMCKYYSLDTSLLNPEDSKGEKRMIGIWEHECDYLSFKTLGAKRYIYEVEKKDGSIDFNMTVAGLPKRKIEYGSDGEPINEKDKFTPIEYVRTHGDFDFFDEDMLIPKEYSCKLTHTYIDEPYRYKLKDYENNIAVVSESSYIHLESQEYNLSLSEEYFNYLMGLLSVDEKTDRIVRPELDINPLGFIIDDGEFIVT